MRKPNVYIATSFVSYLSARLSRDLFVAACQQVTSDWWEDKRTGYDLFASELVVSEAKAGNPDAAAKRLELLRKLPELKITESVKLLAAALITQGAFPNKAQIDALHISIAAVHNIDYLLTWNCRHIDNPATKPIMRMVCTNEGYTCPEICTPIEIMEMGKNEE